VPEVRFFRDRGGHRIAYAEQGQGPLLVLPAWWVSHIERDADNPAFRRFFDALAGHFRVVRYDRLGVGLSDRVPRPFTLDAELAHLEGLVDNLAADRVCLLGFSCGGPIAVAFAARHPARVVKMALYGSYLEGRKLSPDKVKLALVALVRAHWGLGSRALADLFHPGADAAVQQAFKALQREASDAETAARLLELTYALDALPFVDRVTAPVLVLHRKDDRAIAYPHGRELAARFPGSARLVTLEGNVHMPWDGDAQPIVDAVVAFAGEGSRSRGPRRGDTGEAMLRRDGEVWTLRFGGRQVLLKNAKGIGDLARLLARPGEAVHVLEILGGDRPHQATRAEQTLDRKALASYRTRLADIDEALGGAMSEPARARLAKEREALLHQLAVDTGLGGRARKLNDPVERARKAVAARIRDAIKRIAKVHPEVATHLDASVATGLCCVYRPPDATRWEVSPDAI
jgi:pimeloyl-ACP methyl ester carboxylesterase